MTQIWNFKEVEAQYGPRLAQDLVKQGKLKAPTASDAEPINPKKPVRGRKRRSTANVVEFDDNWRIFNKPITATIQAQRICKLARYSGMPMWAIPDVSMDAFKPVEGHARLMKITLPYRERSFTFYLPAIVLANIYVPTPKIFDEYTTPNVSDVIHRAIGYTNLLYRSFSKRFLSQLIGQEVSAYDAIMLCEGLADDKTAIAAFVKAGMIVDGGSA